MKLKIESIEGASELESAKEIIKTVQQELLAGTAWSV
jgi:hypothetical protein